MSTLPARVLRKALEETGLSFEDLRNVLSNNKNAQDALNVLGQWNISSEASLGPQKKDFRFRHLLLKNFRKFGNLNDKYYYGLDFVNKCDDESGPIIDFLTLLGDNGIGKSSLVDSLEYMFTGNIGEAKIRQIPESDFIRNKSGVETVKIYVADGNIFVLNDENCRRFRQEYDVSNFFFSENSILKFAEYTHRNVDGEKNWYPFFCHILGLGALFDACDVGGLLDVIKAEVDKIKNAIGSESVNEVRKKLRVLLQDCCIQIDGKQRDYLENLHSKLKMARQDIIEGKIHDREELRNLDAMRNFRYLNNFSFIKELRDLSQDKKNQASEISSSSQPASKKAFNAVKNDKHDFKNDFLAKIDDCIMHINNVLKYGTGDAPIDDIKAEMLKLIQKEHSSLLAERYQTSEELNILQGKLDNLRASVLMQIHEIVDEYVDQDLVEGIKCIFNETFITDDEGDINFNISNSAEKKCIFINIKEEPVHKYFNTFRYRLFCLTLQAVLNIKMMEKEKFLFPFILDDVFYANDYKNKRELYKYFEQIRGYAQKKLGNSQNLQIVFFTHDEQIVSCFADKFRNDSFVRLFSPDFAKQLSQNEISVPGLDEKYHNLYFELYGE